MKFEESKVINELHLSDIKTGTTGFVADDICTLKNAVTNGKEDFFGAMEDLSAYKKRSSYKDDEYRPFHLDNWKRGYLFYPATRDEVFGEGYVDYLDEYEKFSYPNQISYKEFSEVYNAKDSPQDNWKQYLFSAKVQVSYTHSYSCPNIPQFLSKGYVTLVVQAPNDIAAKVMSALYFCGIENWEDKNNDFNICCDEERYFGKFDINKSYDEIKNEVKLFETLRHYNLGNKARTISFKGINNLPGRSSLAATNQFKNLIKDNYYNHEIDMIINNKYKPVEKSLKSRVEEALNKVGINDTVIYDDELYALAEDFDTNIEKIIKIAKKFESENFDELNSLLANLRNDLGDNIKIKRPNLQIENYTELSEDSEYKNCRYSEIPKSAYKRFSIRKINKSVANIINDANCYYDYLISSIHYRIVPKICNTDEVDHILHQDYHKSRESFVTDKYVVIATERGIDDRLSEELEKTKKDWTKLVQPVIDFGGLSKYDVIDLKNFSGGYYNARILDLGLSNIEGHECIKIDTETKLVKSDDYVGNRFSSYEPILKAFKERSFHLVKIEHKGTVDKEYTRDKYENKSLYFAKNQPNKNYEYTYTKDFWKDLLKGDWW